MRQGDIRGKTSKTPTSVALPAHTGHLRDGGEEWHVVACPVALLGQLIR